MNLFLGIKSLPKKVIEFFVANLKWYLDISTIKQICRKSPITLQFITLVLLAAYGIYSLNVLESLSKFIPQLSKSALTYISAISSILLIIFLTIPRSVLLFNVRCPKIKIYLDLIKLSKIYNKDKDFEMKFLLSIIISKIIDKDELSFPNLNTKQYMALHAACAMFTKESCISLYIGEMEQWNKTGDYASTYTKEITRIKGNKEKYIITSDEIKSTNWIRQPKLIQDSITSGLETYIIDEKLNEYKENFEKYRDFSLFDNTILITGDFKTKNNKYKINAKLIINKDHDEIQKSIRQIDDIKECIPKKKIMKKNAEIIFA